VRLTAPEDLQARSVLVLPRGLGRLSMQWQTPALVQAGSSPADVGAGAAASGVARLASVAPVAAPIGPPSLAPDAPGAAEGVTGTVLVDSSVAPILLLDLPYIAAESPPVNSVGSADGELEVDPTQRLALATNERVRDEQTEVMRWARNNGRSLVWGDCGHAYEWAVAVYGTGVRNVSVGEPLGRETFVAVDDGVAPEAETTPTPEPAAAAPGGPNGIFSPAGGSVVAGTVAIAGAASLPDFWKWQLDILVGGQTASFIAVGEQAVPSPAPLVAWNTANYPNGSHVLRLRVVHRDGNYDEYYTNVTIAN
jgi:hypothetical protein